MSEKYDVGSFGVTHAFKIKEGNLTIVTTQGVGGDMTRPSLASPVTKGMGLKIAGDLLFAPCAAGDVPVGFAAADPNDWAVEPKQAALDGAYERRYCSAVTAGDYIKVGATTAGCYDKGTSSNGIALALEGASASSGAEIAVLFL